MLEMPLSHISTSGRFFSRLSSTIFFRDLDIFVVYFPVTHRSFGLLKVFAFRFLQHKPTTRSLHKAENKKIRMTTLDLTRNKTGLLTWIADNKLTVYKSDMNRLLSGCCASGLCHCHSGSLSQSFHSIIGYFLNAAILLRLQPYSRRQPALLRNTAAYCAGVETAMNHTHAENE